MDSVHTLTELRAGALWEAKVSNTYTSKQWEDMGKPSVLEHAARRVDDLLAAHSPKPLDTKRKEEMEAIMGHFETDHGSDNGAT